MPESVLNKYNELFPSNFTGASHSKNGSVSSSNVICEGHYVVDKNFQGSYISTSGTGTFDYNDPLPKSVRNVTVNMTGWNSTEGISTARVYITNSSGETIASEEISKIYTLSYPLTVSIDLSAYASSNENLYLHIYATSSCAGHPGGGENRGVHTSVSVSSISLTY